MGETLTRNLKGCLLFSSVGIRPQKDKLISAREVLDKYPHLTKKGTTVRNMRMFCLKLAKELIFGAEVMGRCTPGGTRKYPALPHQEMFQLKTIMFEHYPQYWSCLHLFEEVWKQCREVIEQGCKRERKHFQVSEICCMKSDIIVYKTIKQLYVTTN